MAPVANGGDRRAATSSGWQPQVHGDRGGGGARSGEQRCDLGRSCPLLSFRRPPFFLCTPRAGGAGSATASGIGPRGRGRKGAARYDQRGDWRLRGMVTIRPSAGCPFASWARWQECVPTVPLAGRHSVRRQRNAPTHPPSSPPLPHTSVWDNRRGYACPLTGSRLLTVRVGAHPRPTVMVGGHRDVGALPPAMVGPPLGMVGTSPRWSAAMPSWWYSTSSGKPRPASSQEIPAGL